MLTSSTLLEYPSAPILAPRRLAPSPARAWCISTQKKEASPLAALGTLWTTTRCGPTRCSASVRKPPKPIPEEIAKIRAKKWAKEGKKIDRQWLMQRLMPPRGFGVLPRRWVVERTLSWIDQNRRMSKDYERLCASGQALVYAAMSRLMTRRLARV